MALLIFYPLIFLFRGGKMWALGSDFTNLTSLLPSDLIEKMSPSPEVLAWDT